MNTNYIRNHVTSEGRTVNINDWYFAHPSIAIERGDLFVGFASVSIAQAGTAYIQLKTPADKDIYLIGYGIVTDSVRVTEQIVENPTITDGTTALTMINMNRQSGASFTGTIYTDPTSISGGTVIDKIESYEAKKTSGAPASAEFPRLKFKRSEDYVLSLTNGDNNTKTVFVKFYMIEV